MSCTCICIKMHVSRDHVQEQSQNPSIIKWIGMLLASFPGLQSPNAVEVLVKLLRRMTSGDVAYIHDAIATKPQVSDVFTASVRRLLEIRKVTTDCSVVERLSLIERLL